MIDNDMMESVTYRKVVTESMEMGLAKVRVEMVRSLRRALSTLGGRLLGKPSEAEAKALEAITAVDRLEVLTTRLEDPKVTTWSDLLGLPASRPKQARKGAKS